MKRAQFGIALAGLLLTTVLAGCCNWCDQSPQWGQISDQRLVASIVDEQAVEAIHRQRAIYAHHFVPGTADLNELGLRDLAILAAKDRERPGTIHVILGEDEESLRSARMNSIREFLKVQGVEVARMNFDEGEPGGDGINAEETAIAIAPRQQPGPMPILMAPSMGGPGGGIQVH